MPNTIITLKKSATPAAVPSSLEFGELAINYADGALFYKQANNSIATFSGGGGGGDSFGTVNAAGTLIVADTPGDILTLESGTGITITGDAVNDKITISADLSPALLQANTARTHANAAHLTANAGFGQANTARDQANTATTNAGNAFGQANTADTNAINAFGQANTARTHANASFGQANTAFASSNSVNVYSNSTYVKLTSDSQTITGNINVAGSLSISENLTVSAIVANGTLGTAGQTLTSNGSVVYWSTPSGGGSGISLAEARRVASFRI
jgi:hypothetical protein